jgi:hypothetical protein
VVKGDESVNFVDFNGALHAVDAKNPITKAAQELCSIAESEPYYAELTTCSPNIVQSHGQWLPSDRRERWRCSLPPSCALFPKGANPPMPPISD